MWADLRPQRPLQENHHQLKEKLMTHQSAWPGPLTPSDSFEGSIAWLFSNPWPSFASCWVSLKTACVCIIIQICCVPICSILFRNSKMYEERSARSSKFVFHVVGSCLLLWPIAAKNRPLQAAAAVAAAAFTWTHATELVGAHILSRKSR